MPISHSNQEAIPAVPKVDSLPEIRLRPPGDSAFPQPAFDPPSIQWLAGTWHVTHSTLPMWKSKRNVRITYTPLPAADAPPAHTGRMDDLVTYQSLSGTSIKTVHGIDRPSERAGGGAWKWRGTGLLAIASSNWEVLGFDTGEHNAPPDPWVVTYFAKTLFTPAGIDVYSRSSEGLRPEILDGIKRALSSIGNKELEQLSAGLFAIQRDKARDD
ncbi:MAG: hypothetical protein M1819_006699 [Sarea resinae]|nr:MAG: hypothetical protein M1819_006699 [Sarea resinae]